MKNKIGLLLCITIVIALAAFFFNDAVDVSANDIVLHRELSEGTAEIVSSVPDSNSNLTDKIVRASTSSSPEPATLLLFGVGIGGLVLMGGKQWYK